MNISLTPELERYVAGKIDGGLYDSASEVVRAGLRLLKAQDELHQRKLEALRADIQIGLDQADAGRTVPLTDDLVRDITQRGRARRNARGAQGST